MNTLMNNFVDNTVQCWSCSIFDQLFLVISKAAATMYDKLSYFCVILFCVLFAFVVVNAIWQNIKSGATDSWYTNSIQKVIVNAVFILSLLGAGVAVPRFITQIIFEPVANVALVYEENILHTTTENVNERVDYTPVTIDSESEYFFRPQLRDTIIQIAKTTITQFQSYMKLGLAIIDKSLTWNALHNISALIKHIVLLFIGIFLFYNFFQIFIQFMFYFADIIVAMMFVSFFFPLSLVMMAFKGADNIPSWLSGIGKGLGADQIKKLISAIVSLAAAVITYTIIILIIAKFFSESGTSVQDLMSAITSGEGRLFEADLNEDNINMLTITGMIVLVYIIKFISSQIPQISNKIMEAFEVKLEKNEFGDAASKQFMTLTKNVWDWGKSTATTIITGGKEDKKEDKPKDDKK